MTYLTQEAKSGALHNFFIMQFGNTEARAHTLNWEVLNQPHHDLQELERDITEAEIYTAVMQVHPEKASGPDGYTGAFYKVCWDTHIL
jgi:hypothetical protein